MNLSRAFGVVLLSSLLLATFTANLRLVAAYAPRTGDFFHYTESIVVNNGQGSYDGYTDRTTVTGAEQMSAPVSGDAITATYSYSSQFSNSQGSSTVDTKSGTFTWSASAYAYVNGTDNQVGYSKPTYVWFAMNPSLPVGGTFEVLNTRFTVLSRNYSFRLQSGNNSYVQTIHARGVGQYQRNDDYGIFSASYTWDEYFDPRTGYVVGYSYVEQDNGQYQGQSGSFTYTDQLYVTSTSYALTLVSAPVTGPDLGQYIGYLVALAVSLVVIAVILLFLMRRRRRRGVLPEHTKVPYPPAPPAQPPAPWESRVDLGSQPPQQVVIREVAKVNCRYCGTLIPTTADRCPYCGGPRG